MTVATVIGFILANFPAILLVLALVIAALLRGHGAPAHRFLSWVLLLPIGVTFLWAAFYHLVLPAQSAAFIGWQPSPFQFEVGIADLAMGVTACIAFASTLSFKAAAVLVSSISLLGDAAGHIHQMLVAANFAPGNAGTIFYIDIIAPLLAIALWLAAWREWRHAAGDARSNRLAGLARR
ncbi:MAG TPA: DUF6790 family protein [Acetobacteraceae bacterium]